MRWARIKTDGMSNYRTWPVSGQFAAVHWFLRCILRSTFIHCWMFSNRNRTAHCSGSLFHSLTFWMSRKRLRSETSRFGQHWNVSVSFRSRNITSCGPFCECKLYWLQYRLAVVCFYTTRARSTRLLTASHAVCRWSAGVVDTHGQCGQWWSRLMHCVAAGWCSDGWLLSWCTINHRTSLLISPMQ